MTNRSVRLASPAAAAKFTGALAILARLRAGEADAEGLQDFSAPRPSNAPPYLLCLRPVVSTERLQRTRRTPVAFLFVHDPLQRSSTAARILQDALGLTEAEANLAEALQEGVAVADYARRQALSHNTAYTHLRRIKEKTGCKHMAQLIRWLNDRRLPLRPEN